MSMSYCRHANNPENKTKNEKTCGEIKLKGGKRRTKRRKHKQRKKKKERKSGSE